MHHHQSGLPLRYSAAKLLYFGLGPRTGKTDIDGAVRKCPLAWSLILMPISFPVRIFLVLKYIGTLMIGCRETNAYKTGGTVIQDASVPSFVNRAYWALISMAKQSLLRIANQEF